MQCVAHFEVKAEGSVFADGHWVEMRHPKGAFRARIRNIPRGDFTAPFKLTVHLYFEAPSLQEAPDIAEQSRGLQNA
jgi:hypothetical protein